MSSLNDQPKIILTVAGLEDSFEQASLQPFLAKAGDDTNSVFRMLLEQFERFTRSKISFDEYSGVFENIPRLRIPFYYKRHHADFCAFAKSTEQGFRDCTKNKHAVVDILFRKPRSICGQCHLGLTEIVVPLIFRGQFLGAFYAGSAILEGSEENAREKILRYTKTQEVSATPYLELLAKLPKITTIDLQDLKREVQTLKEIVLALLEDWDPPLIQIKIHRDGFFHQQNKLPPLVRRATSFIEKKYRDPLSVQEVADSLGCHAYHLGKVFREHMGMGLLDYLHEVRVQRACILLRAPENQIEAVASAVGYCAVAHFGRVFKARRQVSPAAYRKTHLA
jgi:AraC-like DNA-binding protein/ligand-binding sensor protein